LSLSTSARDAKAQVCHRVEQTRSIRVVFVDSHRRDANFFCDRAHRNSGQAVFVENLAGSDENGSGGVRFNRLRI
jgi:hypothetical protein